MKNLNALNRQPDQLFTVKSQPPNLLLNVEVDDETPFRVSVLEVES